MMEIRKNAREVFRVQRSEFKGTDLVQIRVWYDPGDGELKPGKQGIAIRADLVPDIITALRTELPNERGAA